LYEVPESKKYIYIFLLTVHYEGTLAETGEVFDTTHEDNTVFSFEIGTGSVIKAWDIALRTMKVFYSYYVAIV
jgi:FKBP-type peptidyl-prolyl cis-trans isomerase